VTRSLVLHPIAIASLVVLVVNDHVLKAAYPSWITGKLSDVAGMIMFPIFLHALAARRIPLWITTAATMIAFTLVKTWQPATDAWTGIIGVVLRDASDLGALPFALVGLWISGTSESTDSSSVPSLHPR